jgi:putative SOS response-associated peptidase YedK
VQLAFLRWGLVPFWAKDPSIGSRMINARAETVAEKPSFRTAYRKRRSLILADGFYEWHRDGDVKIPHFISLASGEPFALAGLWETWKDKDSGETLQTTTLITTAANEFMQPLHHRMPVILQTESANEWLSASINSSSDFLAGAADRTPELRAWPVDRRVNNARNQGEELIEADGEIIR